MKASSKTARITTDQLERLRETLENLKRTDSGYPVTAERLVDLAGLDRRLAPHLSKRGYTREVLQSTAKTNASPQTKRMALVFLPGDVDEVAASDEVLFQTMNTKASENTRMLTVATLANALYGAVAKPFQSHWKKAVAAKILPNGVGALPNSGTVYLFLLEWVIRSDRSPSATTVESASRNTAVAATATTSAPQESQMPAFDVERAANDLLRAFDKLDAQKGGRNYVTLFELRKSLPELARASFDATTNHLRRRRVVSLDSADGRHQHMDQEIAGAGIVEQGHNLVFIKRRDR